MFEKGIPTLAFTRRRIAAIFVTFCLSGMFVSTLAQPAVDRNDRGVIQASGKLYPLAHYLTDFTRHDSAILCLGCSQEKGKRITLADFNIENELRSPMSAPGHAVMEIHTSFFDKPKGAAAPSGADKPVADNDVPIAIWKSIVVEVTPEMYREIYFFETEPGVYVEPLSWATVLELDHQRILTTNDRIDGNGAMCTDGYWSLEGAGAAIIDFSQVDKALASHTPKGSLIGETRCWALDMATQTIHAHAQKPPLCKACSDTASITVHFHLQGPAAVPDHVETQLPDDDN
jgi:hypothetical protein